MAVKKERKPRRRRRNFTLSPAPILDEPALTAFLAAHANRKHEQLMKAFHQLAWRVRPGFFEACGAQRKPSESAEASTFACGA